MLKRMQASGAKCAKMDFGALLWQRKVVQESSVAAQTWSNWCTPRYIQAAKNLAPRCYIVHSHISAAVAYH